jgi:hypothetical protein
LAVGRWPLAKSQECFSHKKKIFGEAIFQSGGCIRGRRRTCRPGDGHRGAPPRFERGVADGAVPPIDKPCGEGLMPDGVEALRISASRFPKAKRIHSAAFVL